MVSFMAVTRRGILNTSLRAPCIPSQCVGGRLKICRQELGCASDTRWESEGGAERKKGCSSPAQRAPPGTTLRSLCFELPGGQPWNATSPSYSCGADLKQTRSEGDTKA